MALTTAAKIAIGLTSAAAVTGVGIGIARARKKSPSGMKRDDGSRPDGSKRPVVQTDFEAVYNAAEEGVGYPIDVGTRYEIDLPKDIAAEFAAGRRIGSISLAKIVGGESTMSKSWVVDTDSFEAAHNDVTVSFDLDAKLLWLAADRAGLYVVAMLDREGVEILDEILIAATSKASA